MTVLMTAVMLTGLATAQPQPTGPDLAPSLVGPSTNPAVNAAWRTEVAFESAAVALGLRSPGDVAHERASEAYRAAVRNDTRSVAAAVNATNQVAVVASSNDTRGLEKAVQVLQQVRERTPEQARTGIDTALDGLERAKQRKPGGVGRDLPVPDPSPFGR